MKRFPCAMYAAAVLGLLSQLACGGKAHSSEAESSAGTGQGGTASSGGVAALAGGGSVAVEETQPFYLDDKFPWFDASGDGRFPDGRQDEVLHVAVEGTPARATISTHNVVDLLSGVSELHFSARASEPFRLLVSASHSLQTFDYFAARDEGAEWPIAGVDVTTDWQTYRVSLTTMQPPETSEDGIPSFSLAFIVDRPKPIELWLDEVSFK